MIQILLQISAINLVFVFCLLLAACQFKWPVSQLVYMLAVYNVNSYFQKCHQVTFTDKNKFHIVYLMVKRRTRQNKMPFEGMSKVPGPF